MKFFLKEIKEEIAALNNVCFYNKPVLKQWQSGSMSGYTEKTGIDVKIEELGKKLDLLIDYLELEAHWVSPHFGFRKKAP